MRTPTPIGPLLFQRFHPISPRSLISNEGKLAMTTNNPLRDEMLEHFLAIEPHDDHVRLRRATKAAEQKPVVAASVAERRAMSGATGVPESVAPRAEPSIAHDRRVENPLRTWAQFLYELEHGNPDAGVVRATVNLTSLMGGFAKFRGTEAQQKAAARFKSLYEHSQLGGSKAIDPAIETVDGGLNNPEAIHEIGSEARRELARVKAFLTPQQFKAVEFVIIGENGPTAYARYRLRGRRENNGRMTSLMQVEFRRIMAHLAVHWGYQRN